MARLLQVARWIGLTFGAGWRMAVGSVLIWKRRDPKSCDPWLIGSIVPRIFRATGADYRRPIEIPPLDDVPYVICANHQSHLDVPVIMYSLPVSIRMVAKPSLFKVPIMGRYMRAAGHLMARRKAEVIQASRALLDAGYSVGFFPEGTRTGEGELGPFKAGAFLLAAEAQRPILPVAVFGTGIVLPSGSNAPRPGPVGLRVGAPLAVGGDPEVLSAQTRAALTALMKLGPPHEMSDEGAR